MKEKDGAQDLSKQVEKSIRQINTVMSKRYGVDRPSVFLASEHRHLIDRELIPTGNPALDRLLGGGVPTGVPVEIYGNPASGKTWLAASIIRQVQHRGKLALFINTEAGFPIEAMEFMKVDLDRLLVCDAPQTGAEALDVIVDALTSMPDDVGVIVLDSIAGLMPRGKLSAMERDGVDVDTVGRHAKLMSDFFPRVNPLVGGKTFILINQEREQIASVPMPKITTGGNAVRFYCKLRLRLQTLSSKVLRKADLEALKPVLPYNLDEVDREDVLGITVTARVTKANVGPARPESETTYRVLFDVGYDIWLPVVEEAVDLGLIQQQPGSYYQYEGARLHGKQQLLEYLLSDDERWSALYRRVSELRTGAHRSDGRDNPLSLMI